MVLSSIFCVKPFRSIYRDNSIVIKPELNCKVTELAVSMCLLLVLPKDEIVVFNFLTIIILHCTRSFQQT